MSLFDNVQPEIVERTRCDNDATDRSHAGDAEARTGRGRRRGGRAGRDAGRQLLARQPRHGRRVVRAAVEKSGGSIAIRSDAGRGSVFTIKIQLTARPRQP